jgi:heme-degrading monooxygenase HmoA
MTALEASTRPRAAKKERPMFVAMNLFKVNSGKEQEFEEIWKNRDTYLHDVPGIIRFALLRGENGEYISHSTWESREAFFAWMQSPAFAAGPRQGSLAGILEHPPAPKMFESVLEQEFASTGART